MLKPLWYRRVRRLIGVLWLVVIFLPLELVGGLWLAREVTPYLLVAAPARWRARGFSGLMNQWYYDELHRLERPARLLMTLWDDPIAHLAYRRAAGGEGYRSYLEAHPASAARPWTEEIQRMWGLSGDNLRYAVSASPDGDTTAVLIRTDHPKSPDGDYVSGGRLHLATWSAEAPRWTLRRLPHLDGEFEGFFQVFRFFRPHRPYDFVLEDTSGGSGGAHRDFYYRLKGRDLELVEKIFYPNDDIEKITLLIIVIFYFGSLVILGAAWVLLYIFPPPSLKTASAAAG